MVDYEDLMEKGNKMKQAFCNMRDRHELRRKKYANREDWVNEAFYRGKIDTMDELIKLL